MKEAPLDRKSVHYQAIPTTHFTEVQYNQVKVKRNTAQQSSKKATPSVAKPVASDAEEMFGSSEMATNMPPTMRVDSFEPRVPTVIVADNVSAGGSIMATKGVVQDDRLMMQEDDEI